MWLKLLLSALIIAFCTLLGYLASSKYRSRRAFYAQMYAFNERYLNELAFSRRSLKELFGEIGEEGDFYDLLKRRGGEVKLSYLTEQERKECEDYLNMLGAGDSFSQSNYFSAKKQAIEEKKSESERAARDNQSLYLKLGLLAGLAFVILII